MCVVSQIMDYGRQVFPQQPHQWPYTSPWGPNKTIPAPNITPPIAAPPALPSPEEMKQWIEAFRALVAAGEEALMSRVTELEERLKALEEDLLDKAE